MKRNTQLKPRKYTAKQALDNDNIKDHGLKMGIDEEHKDDFTILKLEK